MLSSAKGGTGEDKEDPRLAESLIVTGKLYESLTVDEAKGQIRVGAEEAVQADGEDDNAFAVRSDNNHWDTLKQFAKFAEALMTGTGDDLLPPSVTQLLQMQKLQETSCSGRDRQNEKRLRLPPRHPGSRQMSRRVPDICSEHEADK